MDLHMETMATRDDLIALKFFRIKAFDRSFFSEHITPW